jgi:hypothetical protein
MGLENLIKLAASLTLAAALSGHLQEAIHVVQVAQLKLLHESQASRWGSPSIFR